MARPFSPTEELDFNAALKIVVDETCSPDDRLVACRQMIEMVIDTTPSIPGRKPVEWCAGWLDGYERALDVQAKLLQRAEARGATT